MIMCGEMRWPPDETDALHRARVTTLVHVILPRGFVPAERGAPVLGMIQGTHIGVLVRKRTCRSRIAAAPVGTPAAPARETATECRKPLRTTTRRGSRMLERETGFEPATPQLGNVTEAAKLLWFSSYEWK